MPTEAEFEAAARALQQEAESIPRIAMPLRRGLGPHVLRGGSLTTTIEDIVDEAVAEHTSHRRRLEALAEECRQRALIAGMARADHERYERELVTYRAARHQWQVMVADAPEGCATSFGPPPSPPSEPQRWPSWAEW